MRWAGRKCLPCAPGKKVTSTRPQLSRRGADALDAAHGQATWNAHMARYKARSVLTVFVQHVM